MKVVFEKGLISKNAIFVVNFLNERGFEAYIVGGAVRDLLLGLKPRDFDVATNAHPFKIKSLFKKAYIVGRRFRLVHLKFKDEIIEISTFRRDPGKPPPNLSDREKIAWANKSFGTLKEDAFRRDFTINSLYYHPIKFELIDLTGGLMDIKNRLIRTIGDPYERFIEDPVRMIRAIGLKAKLNFSLDEELENCIKILKNEILKIPEARIKEEILRILKSKFALETFKLFEEKKILNLLFPFPFLFSFKTKEALRIIDEGFLKDEENLIFLFLTMDLKNFYFENKYFLRDFNLYKDLISKILFSKKYKLSLLRNKKFISALRISSKLKEIYPELRNNFKKWKTFYYANRKLI